MFNKGWNNLLPRDFINTFCGQISSKRWCRPTEPEKPQQHPDPWPLTPSEKDSTSSSDHWVVPSRRVVSVEQEQQKKSDFRTCVCVRVCVRAREHSAKWGHFVWFSTFGGVCASGPRTSVYQCTQSFREVGVDVWNVLNVLTWGKHKGVSMCVHVSAHAPECVFVLPGRWRSSCSFLPF